MAELKTKQTAMSVDAFLARIPDPGRREDCQTLCRMMARITRIEPKMWGAGMVGFGTYHYKYASGHEGDSFLVGFAPRKQDLTIYVMAGFERFDSLMAKLGKHKTGKACLYIKRLQDVDLKVLEEVLAGSVKHMEQRHG